MNVISNVQFTSVSSFFESLRQEGFKLCLDPVCLVEYDSEGNAEFSGWSDLSEFVQTHNITADRVPADLLSDGGEE